VPSDIRSISRQWKQTTEEHLEGITTNIHGCVDDPLTQVKRKQYAWDLIAYVGALQLAHEYSGVRVEFICSHERWIFCIFAQVRIHLSFHFDWRLESREKIPSFRKGDKEALYSTLGAELLRL